MKICYPLLLCAVLFAAISCQNDGKFKEEGSRMANLELLCRRYNTTIVSLQGLADAARTGKAVYDLAPVKEDGDTIGYVVTFTNGTPLTIYDIQNGKKGYSPLIGVKLDADDVWYWTLDESWLLGKDNQKIPVDTFVPALKIEADYWWVTRDQDCEWVKLGTKAGEKAGSIFLSITRDNSKVYFILSNGQTITLSRSGGLYWEYI